MSVETLTIVVSAIGVVLTLGIAMFAGFSWCVRRIDAVDAKLSARSDVLAGDVTELKVSVAELKISVARLEGPPRHLYVSGR